MATGPVRLYGLLALVQVVSEVSSPTTSVAACTVLKRVVPAIAKPPIMIIKSVLESNLFKA